MSRSYKKVPRCGDTKSKFYKRYYNKRFRKRNQLTDCLNHSMYKKYKQHFDICDYESVGTTFEEYWHRVLTSYYSWYYQYEDYPIPDREEEYRKWYRWYKSK